VTSLPDPKVDPMNVSWAINWIRGNEPLFVALSSSLSLSQYLHARIFSGSSS